ISLTLSNRQAYRVAIILPYHNPSELTGSHSVWNA
ncbi:unnamed protein product, partial [Psylliodes chrysocephalus]